MKLIKLIVKRKRYHDCNSRGAPLAGLLAFSVLGLAACSGDPQAIIVPSEDGSTPPALAAAPDQSLLLGSEFAPVVFANSGGAVDADRGCTVDRSDGKPGLPPGLALGTTVVNKIRTCQINGVPTRSLDAATAVTITGRNGSGQSAAAVSISIGRVITDVEFSQVALGNSQSLDAHTCGLARAGALYCWGEGDSGQLGLGEGRRQISYPRQVGSESSWASISAGGFHSCGIDGEGALYCWGYGYPGQLGQGSIANQHIPAQVTLSKDWSSVSAGLLHTCAINTAKELYCWGEGGSGQLGLGDTRDQRSPVLVGSSADWSAVSAGSGHTCGIKTDGSLHCWGADEVGSGENAMVEVATRPARVGTASDWASISAGAAHSCAISDAGALSCWGYGGRGQLGLGDNDDRAAPTALGSTGSWVSVSAGVGSTCAVNNAGELYCWGDEYPASIPAMGPSSVNVPTRVGADSDWASVAAGEAHVCGLKSSGQVNCWGIDTRGQLGQGE